MWPYTEENRRGRYVAHKGDIVAVSNGRVGTAEWFLRDGACVVSFGEGVEVTFARGEWRVVK